VCKVHIQLGKCSECLRCSQRYNIRVTKSEFKRLATEKLRLQGRIKETRKAQDITIKAHKKALEDLRVARAREERLQLQLNMLDRRAEEAIAVEERSIKEQEREESAVLNLEGSSKGLALHLSPST
jgi:hypothetical protein